MNIIFISTEFYTISSELNTMDLFEVEEPGEYVCIQKVRQSAQTGDKTQNVSNKQKISEVNVPNILKFGSI